MKEDECDGSHTVEHKGINRNDNEIKTEEN